MRLSVRISQIYYRFMMRLCFPYPALPQASRRRFTVLSRLDPHRALMWLLHLPRIDHRTLKDVPATIVSVGENYHGLIFYLHGGGYYMGDTSSYLTFLADVARQTHCLVVAIDYRLAPEHPFPAALDDALGAFQTVQEIERRQPIYLMGDSAGGGLALALALRLRDEQKTQPEKIVLLSPWTDLTLSGKSVETQSATDVQLSREKLTAFARWYCPESQAGNPYVSPALADLQKLPPLHLVVGGSEVLLDDSQRIVEKARSAGTPVTIYVGKQMQHVWISLLPWLKESHEAWTSIRDFLKS